MVNLMLNAGGLWGQIIGWFNSFIPSFGLTIIVFTIALKLILSPLEIYQKISTKKQAEVQAKLQPQIEKLQKKFGNNKEMLNQKTMELYKKENFNLTGSCLGMFINLVVTLVVFITLFSSLNSISQYNVKTEYQTLQNTYQTTYVTSLINSTNSTVSTEGLTINEIIEQILIENPSIDIENAKQQASLDAQNQVSKKYGEIKEGFLWVKNIYRPDTYASIFPSAEEYLAISNTNFKNVQTTPFVDIYGTSYTEIEASKTAFINDFKEITAGINTNYAGWNGYLILVVLAGVVTVLSQIITTKSTKAKPVVDKKGNEIEVKQPSNKLMLILLPALMIIFTLQYSSAFALYLVVNSLMSLIIGLFTNVVMNKIEKRKAEKSV